MILYCLESTCWPFIVNPCVWLKFVWLSKPLKCTLISFSWPQWFPHPHSLSNHLLPSCLRVLPSYLHSVLSTLSHNIWDLWWSICITTTCLPVLPTNVLGKFGFFCSLINKIFTVEHVILGNLNSWSRPWPPSLGSAIKSCLWGESCVFWDQLSFAWDIRSYVVTT